MPLRGRYPRPEGSVSKRPCQNCARQGIKQEAKVTPVKVNDVVIEVVHCRLCDSPERQW